MPDVIRPGAPRFSVVEKGGKPGGYRYGVISTRDPPPLTQSLEGDGR